MSVVEPAPARPVPSHELLAYRLEQQRVLAEFGNEALRCRDLDELLAGAAERAAKGMRARFSKVLEHRRDRGTLFLREGVGWRPGLVGHNEVADTPDTPAGYSLHSGEPVIADQSAPSARFRTPDFLVEHGIRRAINVRVDVDGTAFGVLEVDAQEENRFEDEDILFLQAFANMLGLAIGRLQAESALDRSVSHQQLLTREASHRVKNSLAMVSALLGLRMRGIDDPQLRQVLVDAQGRIATIAKAHDLLWRGDRVGTVMLRDMICPLAQELVDAAPGHTLHCRIAPVELHADLAIPLGLMVTELVTNALKYAYAGGGPIRLEIGAEDKGLQMTVADEGGGLPQGFRFDDRDQSSLGRRIIASTARQLRGRLDVEDGQPGAVVRFTMPLPQAGPSR